LEFRLERFSDRKKSWSEAGGAGYVARRWRAVVREEGAGCARGIAVEDEAGRLFLASRWQLMASQLT